MTKLGFDLKIHSTGSFDIWCHCQFASHFDLPKLKCCYKKSCLKHLRSSNYFTCTVNWKYFIHFVNYFFKLLHKKLNNKHVAFVAKCVLLNVFIGNVIFDGITAVVCKPFDQPLHTVPIVWIFFRFVSRMFIWSLSLTQFEVTVKTSSSRLEWLDLSSATVKNLDFLKECPKLETLCYLDAGLTQLNTMSVLPSMVN